MLFSCTDLDYRHILEVTNNIFFFLFPLPAEPLISDLKVKGNTDLEVINIISWEWVEKRDERGSKKEEAKI